MNVPRCRFIKTNGLICKSPSLKGRTYCYFHTQLNDRNRIYRMHERNQVLLNTGYSLPITAIEDAESIQISLSVVINALCAGDLDPQRARTILYGLQLASSNARQLKPVHNTDDMAFEVESIYDEEPGAPAGAQVELPNGPIHGPKLSESDPCKDWRKNDNTESEEMIDDGHGKDHIALMQRKC